MNKPNRKRSVPVYFMVTEQERDLIARNMKEAGTRSIGAYLRKMALDGFIVRLDLSDIREMVRLLRITSSNVNQIAKRANETRSIYEADILELKARYDSLWNQTEEILRGLAKMKV